MAKQTLYLLKYNNYYNRIIKKYETIQEYLDNEEVLKYYTDINFISNDNINTEQILNYDDELPEPDYMLVASEDSFTRWFIIEQIKHRNGQYRFILRRDIVADNLDSIIEAPMYIEKATISDIDDPAIYNPESLQLNQIKTNEALIKDESQVPWIVGYIPRNTKTEGITVNSTLRTTNAYSFTVNGIANWEHYNKTYKTNVKASTALRVSVKRPSGFEYVYSGFQYVFSEDTETYKLMTDTVSQYSRLPDNYQDTYYFNTDSFQLSKFADPDNNFLKNIRNQSYYNIFNSFIAGKYTPIDEDELFGLNGKLIKDTSTNKIYRVRLETESENINYEFQEGDDPIVYLNANMSTTGFELLAKNNIYQSWTYIWQANSTKVFLDEVANELTLTFGADRSHLNDEPYDMFCIPAGEILIKKSSIETGYTSNAEAAYRIAQEIAIKLGQENLYDIQLVPYCPVRDFLDPLLFNSINIGGAKYESIYEVVNETPTEVSCLIWCTEARFSFNISQTVDFERKNVLEKKVASLTNKYRLCAPNYTAAFDFDPQMNKGVYGFNVDCQYKPLSPYIHLCPMFNEGGLYGNDFNDARGITCGGDFSISRVTDAWISYINQNKNYDEIFNRQIENLDTRQEVERVQQIGNILTGAASTAVMGGMLGGALGPAGAAAGAAIGGGFSLGGGIADYQLSEQLRDEAKDYTIDMYNLNMGNIRALPYTLTKTNTFNPNNKIFPFYEFYTCTDIERDAIKNKLKYNGMSIGRIGTIVEFLQPEPSYIKGQLIRLNVGDFHETNAISGELNKGVFI